MLLASAAAADLVVVPQGARTALTLGRPLERYDVALDLSGLDRIVAYEPEDLTVTVEAGVRLGALAERLTQHGQYLPIDPPPDDRVSIGGCSRRRGRAPGGGNCRRRATSCWG